MHRNGEEHHRQLTTPNSPKTAVPVKGTTPGFEPGRHRTRRPKSENVAQCSDGAVKVCSFGKVGSPMGCHLELEPTCCVRPGFAPRRAAYCALPPLSAWAQLLGPGIPLVPLLRTLLSHFRSAVLFAGGLGPLVPMSMSGVQPWWWCRIVANWSSLSPASPRGGAPHPSVGGAFAPVKGA